MTRREYLKALKSSSDSAQCGSFLFCGPEEYTKHAALQETRRALYGEEDDLLNHVLISGESADWLTVLESELMGLPMFADRKLIELHGVNYGKLSSVEADTLYALLDRQKQSSDSLLILYAENAEFDAGTQKKPSAALKNAEKHTVPVFFDYETPQALNGWLCQRFAASGVSCAPSDAAKIVSFCSRDMFALANETDKLIAYTLASGRKALEARDIGYVCCGKSIDGTFDFTNALMRGDSAKAGRMLLAMKGRKEKPENVLGGIIDTLGNMFTVRRLLEEGMTLQEITQKTGLNAYRAELLASAAAGKRSSRFDRALALCLEADLQIKNSPIDNYTVLDRLVMRLCRV